MGKLILRRARASTTAPLQTLDLAPTKSSTVTAFDRLFSFLSRLIARIDLTDFPGSCCG
jgi:hypothetical protein